MALRSSRVSIKPKDSTKMHFTYKETGADAIIDNQGDSVLVVAKTEDTENHEELAQHSVASLGSGTDVLDMVNT